MGRAGVLAVALAGCGRIGFDPGAGAGAGGDGAVLHGDATGLFGDGPVGVVGCVPRGAEVCDGIDNDCNGIVDDGCPCTSFDQTLAIPKVGLTSSAGLVWTGTEYVAIIARSTGLSVITFDTAGAASVEQQVIASYTGFNNDLQEGWSGRVLAIAYAETSAAKLVLYDAQTHALVGAPVTVSTSVPAVDVRARWVSDRFVVMWTDHTTFARREVSETGSLLSGESVVTTLTNQQLSSFIPTPSGHLLCVQPVQTANTTLYAVDAAGTATASTLPFGLGFGCQLDAGPGAYLVSLTESQSQTGPFALVDASGAVLEQDMLPTLSAPAQYLGVTPVSIGTGYWVAATWHAMNGDLLDQVAMYETDRAGRIVAGPTALPTFTTGSFHQPSGVATDGRRAYAVVYDLSPQGQNPTHLAISQRCP